MLTVVRAQQTADTPRQRSKVILKERGLGDQIRDLKRECPKFRCPPDRMDCCIRRTLYSQPDFRGVTSLLEKHCGKRGFEVLFLLRQGRKTSEEMPSSHWMKFQFTSCAGKIFLSSPQTLLTRSFQFFEPVNPVHGRIP